VSQRICAFDVPAPVKPQDILDFWFNEIGENRWFAGGIEIDALVTRRWHGAWQAAWRGDYSAWENSGEGAQALIILLDQFPRNMFRDHAGAFSTDAQARAVAERAIDKGFDRATGENLRAFFYMPFMHSENLADQDKSVELFAQRLGKQNTQYPYALAHRAEIVRFGRFPSRNAALGRRSTDDEREFLMERKSNSAPL
jgi:uncharacterized protein (DUF924 family)